MKAVTKHASDDGTEFNHAADIEMANNGVPRVEDGFGSCWSKKCPECGELTIQVVRPGKAQCSNCG